MAGASEMAKQKKPENAVAPPKKRFGANLGMYTIFESEMLFLPRKTHHWTHSMRTRSDLGRIQ